MKKFIALLISASIIAAPVAFADEQMGNQDASMQQMMNDQAAKPAKKARHSCHCKKGCAHKNRAAKKVETEMETTTTQQ